MAKDLFLDSIALMCLILIFITVASSKKSIGSAVEDSAESVVIVSIVTSSFLSN